jgi:hypothetical protein
MSTTGEVAHLNPDGLAHSAAFTQAVLVEGPARTVYVGGQNGSLPRAPSATASQPRLPRRLRTSTPRRGPPAGRCTTS